MKRIVDGNSAKEIDRYSIEDCKIPSICLMERAALSIVSYLKLRFEKECNKIVAVCGCGNNGADGVCAARIMACMGYECAIVIVGDESKSTEEFKLQKKIALNVGVHIVTIDMVSDYDVIIDAIFGVGIKRNVEGQYKKAVEAINEAKGFVVSVDVPSGIDATTGNVYKVAVKADTTITFGYLKAGICVFEGAAYAGKIEVCDCGFAPISSKNELEEIYAYEKRDISSIPKRIQGSNKGTYGKVLCIAGSDDMSGAAFFSSKAAYRCGTGLVRILTAKSNKDSLSKLVPEAVLTFYDQMKDDEIKKNLDWSGIIVCGPGLSTSKKASHIVDVVLDYFAENKSEKKLILDADALNIIAKNNWNNRIENAIVTPHMGEMSRLTGVEISQIKKNIMETAKEFAKNNKCVCLLKDARSVITDGSSVFINMSGNGGMSTAGTGDVLTGIVAGLLANGMDSLSSASLGAYIHGVAGDDAKENMGEMFMTAVDVMEELKNILPR